MIKTYTDSFATQPIQQATTGHERRVGPLVVPINTGFDTAHGSATKHGEELEHFRLWNYVAITRKASKASQQFPNVSRVTNQTKAVTMRGISKKQRLHLRESYSRINLNASEDLEPVDPSHPLMNLLNTVNPTDWWGSFAYETFLYWDLTGAFYWWAIPGDRTGQPSELWVIPTHWVEPVYTKSGIKKYYSVIPDGDKRREKKIPPNEVIKGMHKNPKSKIEPLSPTRAGSEWIDNAEAVERARWQTFMNGPLPSVILNFDPEHYPKAPTREALTEIGDKFTARYSGVERAGRPVIPPPGVKVEPWGHAPKEMDFANTSDQVRDQVLALHGVPKVIAGITDDVNKASIFGANLIFCGHTINPMLASLAGVVTEKLCPLFNGGDGLRVWFDDCRPVDDEAERAEAELNFRTGAITPDERREDIGRDPFGEPETQRPYIATGFTPLIQTDEEKAAAEKAAEALLNPPAPEGEDDEDDAKKKKKDEDEAKKKKKDEDEEEQRVKFSIIDRAQTQAARQRKIGRMFTRVQGHVEKDMLRAQRRHWRVMQKHAESVLANDADNEKSMPSPGEILPLGMFEESFNGLMLPQWLNAAETGAEFELDAIGIEVEQMIRQAYPDIGIKVSETVKTAIKTFLGGRARSVWKSVANTTHQKLAAAIDAGIKAGEGSKALGKRVMQVFKGRSRKDAIMIARTESVGAMNYSQQVVRADEGVEQKIWIATLDVRTRGAKPSDEYNHLAADGQVVDNAGAFNISGQAMSHPGDGSLGASAGNIINCRCVSTAHLD